jgi:hypothetical protein
MLTVRTGKQSAAVAVVNGREVESGPSRLYRRG